ncbi:sensor domain-containing diguanylate cyclase [Gallaecimonas mangrovi]|uniref:sensor domain-containing diguanylate cyclase n=1 Tax=Gallaecimonas mangrovi TaxID=2291597 RepID=UPI000E208AAE|nr:sensor domain-containing diguanylate cyclase [Gallaecimonas mangrovi]
MSSHFETDFAHLVNQLVDTVFVVDEAGIIVFISQSCETLLGYSQQEMIGTRIEHYMHPTDIERTLQAAKRVMSGRAHSDFENRYLHKNGQPVNIQWSARWEEKNKLRIGVARDITGSKCAQHIRSALYSITQTAHTKADLPHLCEVIEQTALTLPWIERLRVLFFDKKSQTLQHPSGPADSDGPLHPGSALEIALGQGISVSARQHPTVAWQGLVQAGPSNWLAVPLLRAQQVLGAVILEYPENCAEITREQLHFFASQIAATIERKQADEHLRYLAHHDVLTGLANRGYFYERLGEALKQRQPLLLLYLDLDNFKAINDCHGHHYGDALLTEVAARLCQQLPANALAARVGGDEFTLLLPGHFSQQDIDRLLQQLFAKMAAPAVIENTPLYIAASVGSALAPGDGQDSKSLMRHADSNMYQMKRLRQQA